MLSFINFLNYLNDNPNSLSEEQKSNLHNLLFCQTHDLFVTPASICNTLKTSKLVFGAKVLLSLKKYLGLEVLIKCLECGMDQEYDELKCCSYCNSELNVAEDNISVKIIGLLSDDKKFKDNEETVRTEQLNQMITVWERQKFLVYLLIDVSNSESIQDESDLNYIKYLESLRSIIKNEAIHCVKGEHLYFGEIGDCFKIALSNPYDVLPFIERLAKIHYEFYKNNKYPKAVEGLTPYPCIKVSAQLIELPVSKNPKELLCKTLNGSLDFNYSLLTKLFRLDGTIKLKYENVFSDENKMCTWIFDKLAAKIGLDAKTHHIKAFKHEDSISEADVIAFTYPYGNPKLSEEPITLLKNPEAGVAGGD